jgi:hypothetical protein
MGGWFLKDVEDSVWKNSMVIIQVVVGHGLGVNVKSLDRV